MLPFRALAVSEPQDCLMFQHPLLGLQLHPCTPLSATKQERTLVIPSTADAVTIMETVAAASRIPIAEVVMLDR